MAEHRRKWLELSVKEKGRIAKDLLLNPDDTDSEFTKKHNIVPQVLKRIKNTIAFDEEAAQNALVVRILEKDNELLSLSSDVNVKYAQQISGMKLLKGKDVETLDRISNTALKRQAIIAAGKQDGEGAPVSITLTL